MSAIDTAEFRKLTLLAAGIDPTEIPPVLDTAEWRRLLIVAIEQATAGGGGGGAVSSVNTKTGAVVLNAADVGAVAKTGDVMVGTLNVAVGSVQVGDFNPEADISKIEIDSGGIRLYNGAGITWDGTGYTTAQDDLRNSIRAIGGTTGAIDNSILRADGTGGKTSQSSGIVIDDATTATLANIAITNQHVGQTNSAIVITPKGVGAFILGPKPDNLSIGGTQRGNGAVDLQMNRSTSAQVALGQTSVIAGGINNSASNNNSVVSGGTTNTASGNASVVSGGNGNISSNNNSVVSGGTSNTASGNASVVSGGTSNTASGSNSVIAGGSTNTASGNGAKVSGGSANSASGTVSSIGGGANNTASAFRTNITGGAQALADRNGMRAYSAGQFSAQGDAQDTRFVLRCKTINGTAAQMALDGGSTFLGIPNGKVMAMTINISGVKSDGSDVAHYVRQYAVKNVTGTSSQVYAPITIGSDNPSGTAIDLYVNDSDDTLRILVTGIMSETWRWVATVDAVEIAFGT